jgi:hypothetical protein
MSYKVFKKLYDKIFTLKEYEQVLLFYNDYNERTNNNIEKGLLKSLLNKYKFIKKIDPDIFYIYIDIINSYSVYNNPENLINDIKNKTKDEAQINTINRIIKYKKNINYKMNTIDQLLKDESELDDNLFIYNDLKKIYKSCPHCNKLFIGNKKTNYLICGFTYKGFDWKGCGKDWCFNCGKKLCKSWNINQLFNTNNRYHNDKCCKSHAHKLTENYTENYCHCKELYVNRNKS